MTGVALFCVAEEAKPFVYKALNYNWPDDHPFAGMSPYYLIESRVCPEESDGLKRRLKDGQSFTSDFIGASEEDCQQWLLENQYHPAAGQHLHNFLNQDFLFIGDERSARDDTLLVKVYKREGIDFRTMGLLPPIPNTWHTFRVDYKDAVDIMVHLTEGEPSMAYPTYFLQHGDQMVDKNGIFDVSRANRIISGEEKVDWTPY
ncbi:hypothetical protein BDV96DRAFT_639153 [Lophiotrema nucula]|uniref:Uncharacterized protein n=1 Tax=Lophiotrema nucula TaxID=690887 RepID=A0A6A5ZU24_9PLEO|nr:hypothetical protein BDV96DRAFT_639153 [Lophiotrema nucula]